MAKVKKYTIEFTNKEGDFSLTGEFTEKEIKERISHWLKSYSKITFKLIKTKEYKY